MSASKRWRIVTVRFFMTILRYNLLDGPCPVKPVIDIVQFGPGRWPYRTLRGSFIQVRFIT